MHYIQVSVSKCDENEKPIAWTVYQGKKLAGWIDLNSETGRFEFQWNTQTGLLDPGSQNEIDTFVSEANAARGGRRKMPSETPGDFSFPHDEAIKL